MMGQLFAHLVGDYFLQSDWMALNKYKKTADGWIAAWVHATMYTLPFILLTRNILALAVICISHFAVDHFKTAARVSWWKNFLAPRSYWKSWDECKDTFGYSPERPAFITIWLMIIVDNTIHLSFNSVALHLWG
jgi:hypothetical protein